MGDPWNGWFHCMAGTYGSWLRGDARGWRARHHREHVEGDYNDPPPPSMYARLYDLSQRLMTRDPVRIKRELRQLVVDEFVARLHREKIDVVVASIDDHHLHILVRCMDFRPRHWIGLGKKHTSLLLRQLNLSPHADGGIWAKRSKAVPVKDRAHQLRVVAYILRHERKGGAIWALPSIKTLRQMREGR